MEEDADWIDTKLFEDEDEETAEYNWDEDNKDEQLRLSVFSSLREIKFNRECQQKNTKINS